jgi:hypothetical protein
MDKHLVERVVRLILEREEHYAWAKDCEPLTADHVFGDHVLEMRDRQVPLLPRSAAHLEQRVRAITASTILALENS